MLELENLLDATGLSIYASARPSVSFFFFQVTTQLQYIEDSEPVVDGSRNRLRVVQ